MTTFEHLAEAMKKTLSTRTVAEILNALLAADCNPMLTDNEATAASDFFEALADACPDAVAEAQNI